MASIFCPTCGSKSEYQFAKPNFCYKCGNPYSITSKRIFSSLSKKKIVEEDESDYGDDSEDESFEDESFSNSISVPRLSNLKVDIDSSTNVRVLKIEDLSKGNIIESKFQFGKRQNIGDIIDER